MGMSKEKKVPNRLFKYRPFNSRTLDMLVSDDIFFADPSTFNDPLDSQPSLEIDLEVPNLEEILSQFVERRVTAEMSAAASAIKYRGPKTKAHIARHSQHQVKRLLADISYHATNPEYQFDDPHAFLLGTYIEGELLRQYDRGIVSLAELDNCPLMWSHYGDQHHGVCIGYSVPECSVAAVQKVEYGGSRLVQASQVAAMLTGDDAVRDRVDAAVLLQKAGPWSYEQEWRLIGKRGLQDSPLEMEEIVFGMRCKPAVKYALVKALEGRSTQVKFYEIRDVAGTFQLKKDPLDEDELMRDFPRRSLRASEEFSPVSD